MFNTTGLTNGLSLTKIIGGISKTLQIANQMIPLYQKAKPMITNARSIFNVIKGIGKNTSKTIEAEDAVIVDKKNTNINTTKKLESTSPTFFL